MTDEAGKRTFTRLPPGLAWILFACLLLPAWRAEARGDGPEADLRQEAGLESSLSVRVVEIGASASGKPLSAYAFGDGPAARAVLAGIHGGYEWNTTALAEALIAYLSQHPQAVPKDLTLWVVPRVNPDGLAEGRGVDGRANSHGVDLNRNFPALWSATWPRAGCWDYRPITAGTAPASEPETLAMMSLLLSQHVEAVVSYHSAGLGIFPGGQPPAAKSVDLAQTLAMATGYPYPPVDTGCAFTGQLIDWAAANGIAAVDVELTNHTDLDLDQNLAALTAFLAWGAPSAQEPVP